MTVSMSIRFTLSMGLVTLLLACSNTSYKNPPATRGVLDLRNTDLRSEHVRLDGEWEFFKNRFVPPKDQSQKPDGFLIVPQVWNGQISGQKKLGGIGFGTYRLKVLLPENDQRTQLAIKMLEVGTAYSIFVNGHLVQKNGRVGQNRIKAKPRYLTGVSTFPVDGNELNIVIHVSNFENKWGGVWHPVVIGTEASVRGLRERNLLFEFVLFGVLFALGIYHLSFFFFHTRERSALFFGLFCLLVAIRILLTGERYFIHIFPNFNWEWAYSLEYLSFYLAVPAWAAFLHALYPGEAHYLFVKITTGISVIFVGSVLFFPVLFYADYLIGFQLYTLLFGLYSVYVLFRAMLKARLGAKTFLAGWMLLFSAVIIDIFSAQGLIQTFNLVPYGVLIFILSQSLVISRRFSRAFRLEESSARDLEKRVLERTQQLAAAKEEAENLNQAKTQFLSTMSHELRTPMHAIVGIADLLSECNLAEEQQSYIQMLKRSGDRMMGMINEILDMSKIEAGRLELHTTRFLFREMVEHCTAPLKVRAQTKNLGLRIQIEEGIPNHLSGDAEKLEQVILNLLGNAIKFTARGMVELQATIGKISAENAVVHFRILDTGPGIDTQSRAMLFQPFTQNDASLARGHGGTGLGLAISKSLVELMGGTIDCSNRPSGGSIFFFSVQLKIARPDAERAPQTASSSITLSESGTVSNQNATQIVIQPGLQILLAEDNQDNVSLFRFYFQNYDINIETVGDGKSAVETMRTREFDIIIMDIQMPIMDGLDATRSIRAWEAAENRKPVAILALSANAAPIDIERSLAAGCSSHIAKPVLKRELLEAVHKMTTVS